MASFKKLLIAFVVLIALGGLVWFFSSGIKKPDVVQPSEDQEELISSFGYPDTFMLTMQDESRYEIWSYYDMKKSFVFWNGDFVEDQILEDVNEEFQFPEFRPTQFSADMTMDDIGKILGDFTVEAEISSELIENAKVYDYSDQVKVGTKDDKVTYVEILPVFVPEEFRVET